MRIEAFVVIISLIFLVVSTLTYNDMAAEAEVYRIEVCTGSIPNWKGIDVDCPEIQPQPSAIAPFPTGD